MRTRYCLLALSVALSFVILDAQTLPRIVTGRLIVGVDQPPGADVTAPSVTITTPAADPFDAGTTTPQTVSGTASDAVGVETVTWLNSLGGSGGCTGTTSWSCTVALVAGTQTITITATDAALNAGTDTVVMTYEDPPVGMSDCEHCSIQSSFTSAQGWTSDATQPGAGCNGTFSGFQAGVDSYGGWSTDSGGCDQVIAAANYSGGAGGRGLRHVRGPGALDNGGGIKFDFPGTETSEWWLRYYAKYESGFSWTTLQDSKDVYFVGQNDVIMRFIDNTVGFGAAGTKFASSTTWNDVMGGPTGDGQWHCYEWHYIAGQAGDGTLEIWLDDAQIYSTTTATNSTGAAFDWFLVGSNADTVGGSVDVYTDFDDIAFSQTQRVGCIVPKFAATDWYGVPWTGAGVGNLTIQGPNYWRQSWIVPYTGTIDGVAHYMIGVNGGYGLGDGGDIRFTVHRDSNGVPGPTVATATISPTRAVDIRNNTNLFTEEPLNVGVAVTRGDRIWVVTHNDDPAPTSNFVSINAFYNVARAVNPANGGAPMETDDAQMTIYDLSNQLMPERLVIGTLNYDDGRVFGDGFTMSAPNVYHATRTDHWEVVGGAYKVRQRFTPDNAYDVENVHVRAMRVSGSGALTMTITQNAVELANVSGTDWDLGGWGVAVPIGIWGTEWDAAINAQWKSFPLTSVTLASGLEVTVELTAPAGTVYRVVGARYGSAGYFPGSIPSGWAAAEYDEGAGYVNWPATEFLNLMFHTTGARP